METDDERRLRLKKLVQLGKERGYLTFQDLKENLPEDIVGSEQINGIISMINDMGIKMDYIDDYIRVDYKKLPVSAKHEYPSIAVNVGEIVCKNNLGEAANDEGYN